MAASNDGLTPGTQEKMNDSNPLNEVLGDVGRFSYLATLSTTLGLLFPGEWHKEWIIDVIKQIREHLKLPEDMLQVMENIVEEKALKTDQELYLRKLLEDPSLVKKEIFLQDLLSLALKSGGYDARMRVTIFELAELCQVEVENLIKYELALVENFIQAHSEMTEAELEEKRRKEHMRTVRRWFAVGAATIAGGAIIGLTGGLAAPLVASATVALLGPGLAFLGTHAGIVAMASAFGFAGAGLSGYKMKKRVGEVEEFEFEELTEGKDLHVTICISGWLTKDRSDNFYIPWLTVDNSKEIYCLKWESKYLMELGESMEYILNKVMTIAAKEALKYTVLAGLLAALALPATAYAALTAIDNPWGIATNRAAEVGKQLAEVLLMRHQGQRPTTLIGFSMGARVIYFCLKELASRTGSEGIIQDVYFLGAPVPFDKQTWEQFPRVVAGKIYNGYCRGDWLLQFVYRTASVQVKNIVGLDAVPWKHSMVVNVDLTELVNGHLEYSDKMDVILKHMGIKQKKREIPACLKNPEKMKVNPEKSGPLDVSNAPEEEKPCIDAKDLNLSPTRKKLEEVTGISSEVSKSPSLNLSQTKANDGKVRSVSLTAIASAGKESTAGLREDSSNHFSEETEVAASSSEVTKLSKDITTSSNEVMPWTKDTTASSNEVDPLLDGGDVKEKVNIQSEFSPLKGIEELENNENEKLAAKGSVPEDSSIEANLSQEPLSIEI